MRSFAWVFLASLGACARDGDEGTVDTDTDTVAPATPMEAGLVGLQAVSDAPLDVVADRGVIRWLGMDVPLPDGADVVDSALRFLGDHREVWGLEDPGSELVLARIDAPDDRDHLDFAQRIDGVPVFGARLGVHAIGGRIKYVTGSYLLERPLAHRPERAFDEVFRPRSADGWVTLGDPRLTWWAPSLVGAPGAPVLAWQLRARKDGESFQIFVDVDSGEVVAEVPDSVPWDLDLETGNNDTSDHCWYDTTSDDAWYDEDGEDGYPGADDYSDGPNGYNGINGIWHWYKDRFRRNSWDNDGAEVEMYVHRGSGWANARWERGCEVLEFGDSFAEVDVVAHEFTHAVIYKSSNLVYQGQSGALNEGIADAMAAFYTGDWVMGEGVELGTPRQLATAAGRPATMSQYQNTTADFGGVHTNSSIPTRALAVMVDPSLATSGLQIPGLPADSVSCVTYVVTNWVLQPTSTFLDFRNGMLGAFRNHECGVVATLSDQCTVINAFAEVGLGSQDTDCDGLSDGPEDADDDGDLKPDAEDNCPANYNIAQQDMDADGAGDACDSDIDGDGQSNAADNCPTVASSSQKDTDGDKKGDACDDDDKDGRPWVSDNCPVTHNPDQLDSDGDKLGDACDGDDDDDGLADDADNCPTDANPDQADLDSDLFGDVCDNCASVANEDQADCDENGVGKACSIGSALQAEEACELAKFAESVEGRVDGLITAQPGGRIRLPSCLQCGPWVNPADRLSILVKDANRTDQWVITDQDGRRVGKSIGAYDPQVGFQLRLTPEASSRYTLPSTGEIVSEQQYFLENMAPGGAGPSTAHLVIDPVAP